MAERSFKSEVADLRKGAGGIVRINFAADASSVRLVL
jgi:hypothetical protein